MDAWSLVPLAHRDFDFFHRQRSLFPSFFRDFEHHFDDDWRSMDMDSSLRRFDEELARVRNNLFQVEFPDTDSHILSVEKPFVMDADGNRKLALRFNVKQFKPEEITVKTQDNRLHVHAKHVEEAPGRKVHSEFTREYALPPEVDPTKLKSTLSSDGVLQIEAPAPPSVEAPKEVLIPIEKM